MHNKIIKVGIVGGTGYTSMELLRILASHKFVDVHCITSRKDLGTKVSKIFGSLHVHYPDLVFSEPEDAKLYECDLLFLATPHGVAASMARDILDKGIKIIDLSADFRIKNLHAFEKAYAMKHPAPDLLEVSVYGLPEYYREQIKRANLIANPGCYPTSIQLALLPLLTNSLINTQNIIADCKSGVSGAGRGPSITALLSESSENINAYGLPVHRHVPEINQELSIHAQQDAKVIFVPHLTPMIRGIHASIYADMLQDISEEKLYRLYRDFYQHEYFVTVLPDKLLPQTKFVRGSNHCMLQVVKFENKVLVLSVIDNLVRGASGQAIVNMNIMFGLPENTSLESVPIM